MRGLKVSPGSIYRHFPSEGGSSGSGHAGVAASHPRLVQTCRALVSEFRFVEAEHVVDLTAQVQHIIASVIKRGESHVANPAVGAAAALPCITQFRHPLLASEWHLLDIHEQLPPLLRSSSPASRTPFHPPAPRPDVKSPTDTDRQGRPLSIPWKRGGLFKLPGPGGLRR
ncbi:MULTISPECIES: hypothetical protein [Micromonospora]